MPRYTVYYAKSLPDLMSVPDVFKVSDYLNMGELEAESLEQLFRQLQDTGDAAFVGRCMAHLIHASLSPGDVAEDELGQRWVCDFAGWKRLAETATLGS